LQDIHKKIESEKSIDAELTKNKEVTKTNEGQQGRGPPSSQREKWQFSQHGCILAPCES